jgi:hypothetical protein
MSLGLRLCQESGGFYRVEPTVLSPIAPLPAFTTAPVARPGRGSVR